MINDAKARRQHELDLVALGRDDEGAAPVLALGEAKHSRAKRTTADLAWLESIRTLVAAKHPSAAGAKLLLFSASGFDPILTRASRKRSDVELIDIARLYHGS